MACTTVARDTSERIAIIGSGLAGLYAAILFAKQGIKVDVYEKRK